MQMHLTAACALFLFGLVAAPSAQAQTPWEIGPHLGANLDNDEFLLGGTARFQLESLPITLNPGLEFYPGLDDTGGGLSRSLFVLNFDVQYQLDAESVEPYVGGGLSWATLSTEGQSGSSDLGLNLKGGLVFNPSSSTRPYVEASLNLAGGTELIFRGGLLFTIGG